MGIPRQKWTEEEEDALRAGVAKHGTGKWKNIQQDPQFNPLLYSRSNIDLKDKWRNMSVGGNGQGPREKARTPNPKPKGADSPATPMPISQVPCSSSVAIVPVAIVPADPVPTDVIMEDSSKCLLDGKTASKINGGIQVSVQMAKGPREKARTPKPKGADSPATPMPISQVPGSSSVAIVPADPVPTDIIMEDSSKCLLDGKTASKVNGTAMGNPKQKWTQEEEDALRAGVAKHGTGKWKNIQKDPEFNPHLYSRSNIDLKDKWRNMSVGANDQGPREKARTPKPKGADSPATPMPISQVPGSSSVAIVPANPVPTDVIMEDSSKCLLDGKTASKQSDTKNDETVNNNNVETKKDETVKKGKGGPKKERVKQSKVGAKKDKEAKKEDKVPKSPTSDSSSDASTEANSVRKRARCPRPTKADSSDQEIDELVGPSAFAIIDDDASVETVVSVWKSAISGVGQEFSDVYEFREALQRYAMANGFGYKLFKKKKKNGFEYKLKKNDTDRASGVCTGEGCSWKFNAVWVPTTQSFKIKTMNNVHTCDLESRVNSLVITLNEKLQESPHLQPKEIANQLLLNEKLQKSPRLKPKKITNQLLKDSGVDLKRGTMVVRDERLGSDKESYNLLPWFCDKIIETNPGSISKLIVGENKRFKALFVSFYASLYGFQNSCRPLLFFESTSLRSMYGEVLLTANAIDGNDDFFPVAFAIVDVEDDDNWRWFLEQLKAAILYSQPMTFVFDMEKNLKMSVFEVFQDAYVGYSIYHLLESFKRNVMKGPYLVDGKSFLPVYFLAAAHAVRLVGFRKSIEQIKLISSQVYDWVMQIEPQHWAASSFKGERYNHITDDVGGSLAKLMEDYQESSILQKIDALIRTMIDAITDAKLDACMWNTHLTPSKEKQLQDESLRSCSLKVLISSDTLFEVREESTHVVNIGDWSCTCLGWKETGLPCRHSLAVFALIGRNPYEYCASYFTVDAYRLTYLESINQVPIEMEESEKFEVGKPGVEKGQGLVTVLVLPPIPVKPAVVKKNMEWEEKEFETTKRTVTCTNCKQTGHNKKSCDFYQAQEAGELTFVN